MKADEDLEELFVGRDDEVRRLLVFFSRRRGGLIPIGGHPGTGKSTFVNFVQRLLVTGRSTEHLEGVSFHRAVPCSAPFEVRPDDGAVEVLRKALTSLCRSVEDHCKRYGKSTPKQVQGLLQALTGHQAGGKNLAIGGSWLGHGANVAYGSSSSTSSAFLTDEFALASRISEIAALVRDELESAGAVIVIDNTELLEDAFLCETLSALRDTALAVEGLWWIVIGRHGLGGLLSPGVRRLRGYVAQGLDVADLTVAEFASLLELRRKYFTVSPETALPISLKLASSIYLMSNGDIRMTMDFLESAISEYVADHREPVTQDDKAWLRMARTQVERYMSNLATNEPHLMKFVKQVVSIQIDQVTAQDHRRFGYASEQELIVALGELADQGLMRRRKAAKEEWTYIPSGYLEIARFFRNIDHLQ
ncbi:ATP-binding protein [Sphingomonas glacialis]|uniref:ATP-binding protein n=1 Tax=Sphingomonas glacialis TaxID=658225 RepID=A0A502FZW5_9SPHN|nr:ATP-binding protein [Sphingomonas glacialis]